MQMSKHAKLVASATASVVVLGLVVSYAFLVRSPADVVVRLGANPRPVSQDRGWSTEGYLSEIAKYFAQVLFGGIGSVVSDEDLNLMQNKADQYLAQNPGALGWGGKSGSSWDLGGGSKSGKGGKTGGGGGTGGGYSRSDVVSYNVTHVEKNGDRATVYGTATMKDGKTVSGAVNLKKVGGEWQVTGYSGG